MSWENRENTSLFKQDGAHLHQTDEAFNFLDEHFDDRVAWIIAIIEKSMDWPPYSQELTPCDFFMYVCVCVRESVVKLTRYTVKIHNGLSN